MNDLVHYLIKHPVEGGGLIYPTEIEDDNYVGFGAFYLLGQPGMPIGDRYRFAAVRGEETIQTELLPFRRSRSFFQAEVGGIGSFIFYAQPISFRPSYTGRVATGTGLLAIRRLRSWQPQELDRACREHKFYFVGYSPRLGQLGAG